MASNNYADDTQLYVALSLTSMVTHVSTRESCLESLQAWFCANRMTLNADKSNAILFATSRRAQSLSNQVSVNISGITIPLSSHVKILAVVLDPRITLSEHTKAISKSCFYHICALKHIRDSLDFSMTRTIAAALVSSSLVSAGLCKFCTASPQSISLASSVLKILSHVLLQVVALSHSQSYF